MMVTVKPTRAPVRRNLPGSPFNTPVPVRPVETYDVNDQVTHDQYGLGVILGVEEDAVVVNFRSHHRRVTLPCAKLGKL
jgi:hypothetical protein